MFKTLLSIFLLAFTLTAFTPTYAANYSYNQTLHEIIVVGDFTKSDEYKQFDMLVSQHPDVKGVRLINSHGGMANDMVNIGNSVYRAKLWTYASGYCHSSCGYIWLAGTKRYVDSDTLIIEHLPNIEEPGTNGVVSQDGFDMLFYYFGQINVPYVLGKIVESSADYYDNNPFDFRKVIDAADPDHEFYTVLPLNGTPS